MPLVHLPELDNNGRRNIHAQILSSPQTLAVSGYDDEIQLGLAIEQHDRNDLHIGVDSTLFTPGRHGRFDLPCQRAPATPAPEIKGGRTCV